MPDNVFLDKGILLGYCFTVDKHHQKCKDYLSKQGPEVYITEYIDGVYEAKVETLIKRHREAILDHVNDLTRSHFDGEIGPMEAKKIKSQMLTTKNEAWRYLRDYYDNISISSVYQVKDELRGLTRELDKLAEERKEEFDERVQIWTREKEYSHLEEDLGALKADDEEDYWVCVDAHDFADRTDGETELATNNPSDYGENSHGPAILEHTAIDTIEIVAVTKPRQI